MERAAARAAGQRPLARHHPAVRRSAAGSTPSSRGSTSGPASSGASGARSRPVDVSVELLGAAELLRAAVERASSSVTDHADAHLLGNAAAEVADDQRRSGRARRPRARPGALGRRRAPPRSPLRHAPRPRARGRRRSAARALPRLVRAVSALDRRATAQHGTLRRRRRRASPYVAELGFDVVYLPPIHPIGRAFRKGPNNTLDRRPRRRRQPVGHRRRRGRPHGDPPAARHARRLPRASSRARASLGLEVALDIAFQASPDHPYVSEHPEWFVHRPDGTHPVRREPAEEVPGRLPVRLRERRLAARCGTSCATIFLFWIEQGVTRLPRRQPAHQAAAVLGVVHRARSRRATPRPSSSPRRSRGPKLMYALAKVGFSQSYTYFTWRTTKWELDGVRAPSCAQRRSRDYFRPNFWPNTPDILPEHLQCTAGAPAFVQRLVLAATLVVELRHLRPAVRADGARRRAPAPRSTSTTRSTSCAHWDLDARRLAGAAHRAASTASAASNPALQDNAALHFHADRQRPGALRTRKRGDDGDACSSSSTSTRTTPTRAWLDARRSPRSASHADETFQVHDLLGERALSLARPAATSSQLDPHVMPAHMFRDPPPRAQRARLRVLRMMRTVTMTAKEKARGARAQSALVQGRDHLRDPHPRLRRLQRRRHRRLQRPDRASSTTCRISASPRSGCCRSIRRRCATAATTSPTTRASTRPTARSRTSRACSTRRTAAASA